MLAWLFKKAEPVPPDFLQLRYSPITKWEGVIINEHRADELVVELDCGRWITVKCKGRSRWIACHEGMRVFGSHQGGKYTFEGRCK